MTLRRKTKISSNSIKGFICITKKTFCFLYLFLKNKQERNFNLLYQMRSFR